MTIMDTTTTDRVEIILHSDGFVWQRTDSNDKLICTGDVYNSAEVCRLAAKRFNRDVPAGNIIDQTR